MKKKSLLLFLIAVIFILLLSVFLPSALWKVHLKKLSREVRIEDCSNLAEDSLLTPLAVAELFHNTDGKFDSIEAFGSELPALKEAVTGILESLFQYCSEEDHRYLSELIAKTELEYYYENPIPYQKESLVLGVDLADCFLCALSDDLSVNLALIYEKKTGTIASLELTLYDYSTDQLIPLKSASLEAAVENYYEQLGIPREYYSFEPGSSFSFALTAPPDSYEATGGSD